MFPIPCNRKVLACENAHISGPNWQTLIIYMANLVNSCVLLDIMMTRNVQDLNFGWKHEITMTKSYARILWLHSVLEKCHILGPSWPILVIFLAIIVNSYVLIDIMMTRNVHEWILQVKTWVNHEKNQARILWLYHMGKIAIFQAPVDQSWWFLWLIWSFHMCWCVLWWLELPKSPLRGLKLAWKRISPPDSIGALYYRGLVP